MKRYGWWCTILLCATLSSAHATRNVSGPGVDAGDFKYELRSAVEFDDRASKDERITQLFFVDYGINDWLAFRATAKWQKPEHQSHELTATEAMLRVQLLESGEDGFALGTRLIYTDQRKARTADGLAFQMLAEQKMDPWRFRATAELEREMGGFAESSLASQMAAQALYRVDKQFAFGAEWFGDVGNLADQHGYSEQQHQFGPVTVWHLSPAVEFEVGYLHGVSHAASDHMIKWFVRGEF